LGLPSDLYSAPDNGEEIAGDLLRGLFHFVLDPPADGFHEGGGNVIDEVALGQGIGFGAAEGVQLAFYQVPQIGLEIEQKQLVISDRSRSRIR
jgi:hypothetical protein